MVTTTPTADTNSFLGSDSTVARLYDNVQAQVPAIGLTLIKLEAWNVIEEFYLRSTARRETVYWNMASGVYSIDFNPFDENWLVCWILAFTGLTNAKIEPPSVLKDLSYPHPTDLRTGQALVALKPVSFVSDLGSVHWQQWFEAILDGTLHRLYRQPAKPWSSPQLALFHGRRYMAGINRARAAADHSFTDGGGRWSYPYFAGGRRKN